MYFEEIIKKHKVPKAANTLSLVLILFMLLFFGLNIANLLIIKSDMQVNISNYKLKNISFFSSISLPML